MILIPILDYVTQPSQIELAEGGIANRIFWPSLAALSIVLAVRNLRFARRQRLAPHISWLIALALYAGASTAWAIKPELSFVRCIQQAFILISILLPPLINSRPSDLIPGVCLCFNIAVILNIGFLFDNSPALIADLGGYYGYFRGKNYLGEFSSLAFILSLYQARQSGTQRIIGICVLPLAITLLVFAGSKTALGLVLVVPFLAWVMLAAWRKLSISPAIFLALLYLFFEIGSTLTGITTGRLAYIIYHDSTFTGRTIIWDFLKMKISQSPILGWGYQSFWLIGPEAPNIREGWGFIKNMPEGHSGYYDIIVELGYIGYSLLLAFLFATLHAIRRIADFNFGRAYLMLSVCLLVMFHNFLESLWMRGYEMQWVVFVIMATEIARYQRSTPNAADVHCSARSGAVVRVPQAGLAR
jgi:O-antigen ligase